MQPPTPPLCAQSAPQRAALKPDARAPPPSRPQVALDIEYHRNMLDLHLRVSPKDVMIGWYSTGAGITDTDALIHVRCPWLARCALA